MTFTHSLCDTDLVFSHLFFQGANLQGVKMLCTNAEGASLKGCNFEDPAGLKANLEGKMSTLDLNWSASLGSHIPSL